MSDERFLSRWSRLKRESKEAPAEKPAEAPVPTGQIPATQDAAAPPAPVEPAPLPPIESLTPESDFTAFMRSDVDPSLRRQALKTLFRDPHFNVMDGLDVYIDDYTKADPLPEGWLEKMNQFAALGAHEPPKEETSEPPATPEPASPQAVADDSPTTREGIGVDDEGAEPSS